MLTLLPPLRPPKPPQNHHKTTPNEAQKWDESTANIFKFFLGSPLKVFASVGHWALWHFDLNKYTEKQRPRVLVSLAAVAAFVAIGFPAIIYTTGARARALA